MLDGVDVRLGTTELPDAAVYVDASYEGDLLARLRRPVRRRPRVARASTASAGPDGSRRTGRASTTSRCCSRRSPTTARCSRSSASRSSTSAAGRPSGSARATAALQAYGFRVCLTDRAGEPPARSSRRDGYDPREFELLRRYLVRRRPVEARDLLGLVPDLLPNGKCDVNSIGPFSLNLLDGTNRDYPDGDAAARERVRERAPALHAGASSTSSRTTTPCRAHPRRGRRAGACAPTSSRTPAAGRTSSTSATARRMLGEHVLRERDLLDARRSRRRRRARLVQHRHPRGRAHVAATCPSTSATPAVFNEGYLSVAGAAVPDPVPLADAAARGRRRTCSCRSACRRRTSRSARCGWSRR